MFIYDSSCISPQHTFGAVDLDDLVKPVKNVLHLIEPKYEDIPLNILRRMGKAVRMGTGAALPLIKSGKNPDGIIIGSANGGMEDCIKFLAQLIQYEEGRLTPTNFVQSTPNAIASQIGLTTSNHGYNITHVHRGLAFENALLDAMMMLTETKNATYLIGGVDEVSSYNYNLERLGGWYKMETVSGTELYSLATNGSIAGEGAAMFLTGGEKENAMLEIRAVKTLHSKNPLEVQAELNKFIAGVGNHDAFLSGENGDVCVSPFYTACEKVLPEPVIKLRYKHFTGEHPSTSALALWLSVKFCNMPIIPSHFFKSKPASRPVRSILLYNTGKGEQHSFISVSSPN